MDFFSRIRPSLGAMMRFIPCCAPGFKGNLAEVMVSWYHGNLLGGLGPGTWRAVDDNHGDRNCVPQGRVMGPLVNGPNHGL